MPKIPPEHQALLRYEGGFELRCPPNLFERDELDTLHQFGCWLEALASGAISPFTPEQQHFVDAAKLSVGATTSYELLWRKLVECRRSQREPYKERDRREYRDAHMDMPVKSKVREIAEKFGMDEWDFS